MNIITINNTIKENESYIEDYQIPSKLNQQSVYGGEYLTLNHDEENEQKIFDEAVNFGLKSMKDLYDIKEPLWYRMGLVLDESHPASKVAHFGAPISKKALEFARYGYATLEASRKIAQL